MTFDSLEIVSPGGCTRLRDEHAAIRPGEHVLVTGDPSAGKTLFFRAVAGLWPWGTGRIGMPAGQSPVFVPRTPYFAPGTLREVLDGSDGDKPPRDEDLKTLLAEVGLERLSGSLDRTARWDHELSEDEQRILAFVSVALRQPDWVVIDEALDTFDGATAKRVLAMFAKHLPKAAILNIGRGQHNYEFFPRTLDIVKDTSGKALGPARIRAGAVEPPPPQERRRA